MTYTQEQHQSKCSHCDAPDVMRTGFGHTSLDSVCGLGEVVRWELAEWEAIYAAGLGVTGALGGMTMERGRRKLCMMIWMAATKRQRMHIGQLSCAAVRVCGGEGGKRTG